MSTAPFDQDDLIIDVLVEETVVYSEVIIQGPPGPPGSGSSGGGIATSIVDIKGDLIVATGPDVVSRFASGTNGQVLSVDTTTLTGLRWVGIVAPVPISTIVAKGDVIAGTGNAAIARVAVGANGTILTADSTAATGIRWATPAPSGIQATLVDAKGDIIVASAADAVTRLGVGTNGQVLVADSSTATGLRWSTIDTGSGITDTDGGTPTGTGTTLLDGGSTSSAGTGTIDGGTP